jgi:hypothetical protein
MSGSDLAREKHCRINSLERGKIDLASLDFVNIECRYKMKPADPHTNGKISGARQAMRLLDQTLKKVTEERVAQGSAAFHTRQPLFDPCGRAADPGYFFVAGKPNVISLSRSLVGSIARFTNLLNH